MDGKRIREYFSTEVEALLATYRQFQILIPSETTSGAAHSGEDGRYVESLITAYLRKFLPKELEILTGFILRPAVKTGINGKHREGDSDTHSSQLDIIVYDSSKFPVYQRFEANVIVPPEGVIAVFSVKKHLRDADIVNECSALKKVSELCVGHDSKGVKIRNPYLGLISMESLIKKGGIDTKSNECTTSWIFKKLEEVYGDNSGFEDLVGYVGSFSDWSIFKKRPSQANDKAEFVLLEHKDEENHLALQFLLTGVLSVYYDPSRNTTPRPGFTAFESGRNHNRTLGKIPTDPKK
ncbi:MAG: hypothetical protein ACJAR1_001409 [Rubritalea sp.]|jgi:hypothetical protein